MYLIKRILGGGDAEVRKGESNSRSDAGAEIQVECSENGREEETAEPGESMQEEVTRREGTITVLDQSLPMGVIDQTFKFYKSKLKDAHLLKRGMRVSFIPREEPGTADMIAEDVRRVVGEKEAFLEERGRHKVVNFKVVTLEDDAVVLGKDDEDEEPVRISKEYLPTDYAVVEGDWLEVELEAMKWEDGEVDPSKAKIVKVNWIDKTETSGVVTRTEGFFCINGTIFFTQDVVKNQRILNSGDHVVVVAVASDQEAKNYPSRTKDGISCKQYRFRKRAVEITYQKVVRQRPKDAEEEDWLAENQEENNGSSTKEKIQALLANKSRIKVRPGEYVRFDDVVAQTSVTKVVIVENFGSEPVVLRGITFMNTQDVCEFEYKCEDYKEGEAMEITPRARFTVMIQCNAKQIGRTEELCIFDFGVDGQIGRWLKVTAVSGDEEWMKRVKTSGGEPSEKWRKRSDNLNNMAAQVIEERKKQVIAGPKMFRPAFFIPNKIGNYPIPDSLYEIFKMEDEDMLRREFPINYDTLDAKNYVMRFQVSLWLEELENQLIRRNYDIQDVVMKPFDDYLVLTVPHFKEILPSVMLGDQVHCYDSSISKEKYFQGTIEKIICPETADPLVYISFNEAFLRSYRGTPVERIHFCLSRSVYRRQHFAVIHAMDYLGPGWLFPDRLELKPPRVRYFEAVGDEVHPLVEASKCFRKPPVAHAEKNDDKQLFVRERDTRAPSMRSSFNSNVQLPAELGEIRLRWYNPSLNKEQRDAVRRVLSAQGRPLPYVIFGPPGTGKTVTVVESILQIYFLERTSRILVTVPSNAGADLIAEHLAATCLFKPGDFVRLNGFLRSEVSASDLISDFCVDGTHLDSVAKHRLIICTVTTAGQFFQLNLNTGHFSHVFIDEAGYCTEPEAMIPCVLAAIDKEAVIVLAGDPQQLGPVLMNDMSINTLLKKSFLERIMETKVYQRDEAAFPETKYNPAVLTKLVRSYRAHPKLLKVPSELFYDDELVSYAGAEAYEFCGKNLNFLINPDVPLVFHGVKGKCSQDKDSPSWYNIGEVAQVAMYVRKLRAHGVSSEDIGIITPYRKQVEKLRFALQYRLMDNEIPKIASVQEFQGGERKVIIISTVRSEYEDIIAQKISRLDFLYSRKLFNVAVTRAKGLIIVVGNPDVLHYNKYWKRFLDYCIDQGVYTGCNLPTSLNQRLREEIDKLEPAVPPLLLPEMETEDDGPEFPDGEDCYAPNDFL